MSHCCGIDSQSNNHIVVVIGEEGKRDLTPPFLELAAFGCGFNRSTQHMH